MIFSFTDEEFALLTFCLKYFIFSGQFAYERCNTISCTVIYLKYTLYAY